MTPTLDQRFTLRPLAQRTQVKADAQATHRESWWLKFATAPRDDQFAAAVEVRFPSVATRVVRVTEYRYS